MEYPECGRCKGDLVYDIKIKALDGKDTENGFHLSIGLVCNDCGSRAMPTEQQRRDMTAIATFLTPEDAVVTPGGYNDEGSPESEPD